MFYKKIIVTTISVLCLSWIFVTRSESQVKRDKAPETKMVTDLMLGMWVPAGKNELLGVHPTLGLRSGGIRGKTLIQLMFEGRFFKSWNSYSVRYNDTTSMRTCGTGDFNGRFYFA